jgi:hypothetical protein
MVQLLITRVSKKLKTSLSWQIYLAVWLGDQNSLAVMDGDLRWTDLNLELHGVPLPGHPLRPIGQTDNTRSPAAGLTACNGVPCRERCGKPRLSVNGHHPTSFALKIAVVLKGEPGAGLVPSLAGWMVRLLALYDKPEPWEGRSAACAFEPPPILRYRILGFTRNGPQGRLAVAKARCIVP